jgi:hypothetical protein
LVEKLSSATLGSAPISTRVLSAVAMAISANCPASGSITTAQSAKAIRPLWPSDRSCERHDEDARHQPRPRCGPTACSAARTVSAVLFAAPPTLPSASPAPTISDAK